MRARLDVNPDHRQESGVSRALATARARFEATPRKLDDQSLDRIARGDRGCLGDVLSGLGAVLLVATMILGAVDIIAYSWAYVGLAIWIAGFGFGTYSQMLSGRQRKAALESSPLVLATVVHHESWLVRPGKQAGRAVVLFTTSEHRFDRDWLEAVAGRVRADLGQPIDEPNRVALRRLLADRDSFGCHPIANELSEGAASWLAAVIIHPDRLVGGYLGAEDDRDADERGLAIGTPARPPVVVLFVDPQRGFIEQAPAVEARQA